MVQHHSTMFYGLETAWQEDTSSDSTSYSRYRLLQILINLSYGKSHWQEDVVNHTCSGMKTNRYFQGKKLCYFHFCLPFQWESTLEGMGLLM